MLHSYDMPYIFVICERHFDACRAMLRLTLRYAAHADARLMDDTFICRDAPYAAAMLPTLMLIYYR